MHPFLPNLGLRRRFYARFVGIMREEKNRWECRAPLTPKHVHELQSKHDIRAVVQPCSRRIFSNDQYHQAGAIVSEDLSGCDLILGVKEVLISKLIPQKAYMFFSHTHKGQRQNLPLLRAVCEKKVTLLDYELLTNDQGTRLVAFGRFAGYAGIINALHGLGDRFLTRGIRTPFLRVPMTQHFDSLEEAKKLLASVGKDIQAGLHEDISPVLVVFTGRGNVSQVRRGIRAWE
jgi:alpha-aminoadipic semialdehyde synthase